MDQTVEDIFLELTPLDNLFFTEILNPSGFCPPDVLETSEREFDQQRPVKPSKCKLNYYCKYCEFQTSWLSNLKRHENTHLTRTFYRCQVCKKDFNQISNLKTHLKNMHQKLKGSMRMIEKKNLGGCIVKYYS
jgi:drumstick